MSPNLKRAFIFSIQSIDGKKLFRQKKIYIDRRPASVSRFGHHILRRIRLENERRSARRFFRRDAGIIFVANALPHK